MKACIVSFSGRENGNCSRIAQEAARILKGEDVALFDLAKERLHPCGRCCCECFADRLACPHIDDVEYALLDALTNCDRAYLIVPNYCDYPGALYFAFNERSLCYFSGHEELLEKYAQVRKRFIVVSGGERTRFVEIFHQQTGDEAPEVLILNAREYGRQSIAGDLMEHEDARAAVKAFVMQP